MLGGIKKYLPGAIPGRISLLNKYNYKKLSHFENCITTGQDSSYHKQDSQGFPLGLRGRLP